MSVGAIKGSSIMRVQATKINVDVQVHVHTIAKGIGALGKRW